ncbi:nucleoside-diphosphate-sugar epimerase [Muricomes intestini]|uniref:Nucleoside-diphosphate-sugar epimerase n=1 Tax=Muricomes intestini TaxID=1796634 RepID=A0A4R3K2H1_9FIRM|nr:NAD(P)-dependent oxidoreductase [Muricomes intestini]TCS76630.1 nucleoside-diphosphate-sugar epimerase [Muricomes intestini]
MLMYTKEYMSDLTEIQNVITNLDRLRNAKVLITGAGGLIGSALVDFLQNLNRQKHLNIYIYAAARDYKKIERRFGTMMNETGFFFLKYDALQTLNAEVHFDYIIHAASNAYPSSYMKQPVETMLANIMGLKTLLDYGNLAGTKRIVYISSSEVYGKKDDGRSYSENDYSFLDILNPRACYPSSKRAAETLCSAYQQEFGVDYVIVRPGHVYGPTMTDFDNRASSQFPRDVLNGKDIVMKSMGTQVRSYCYVLDCVSAIIFVMLNGILGNAYNISNKHSIVTIREMAECFAKAGGRKVIFEEPSRTEQSSYNFMDNSSLSSEKIEALGWKALFDLNKGVRQTLMCCVV